MDRILFGTFSLRDLIVAAVVVVVASVALRALVRALRGSKRLETRQVVRCGRCNWVGQVSRYAGRCPSCNEPLGDQIARR